jgi:hypothetical protein
MDRKTIKKKLKKARRNKAKQRVRLESIQKNNPIYSVRKNNHPECKSTLLTPSSAA